MTHEEIDAMEAGRELDALIAENVMGWIKVPGPTINGGPERNPEWQYEWPSEDRPWSVPAQPKPYSTNIVAVWDVVDKWRERTATGYGEMALRCEGEKEAGLWVCAFGIHEATAPTAPLAICRAALKAVTPPLEARIEAAMTKMEAELGE